MNINRVLEKIPDYKEFLTVEELDESSRQLADEFDSVKMVEAGKSREGRPISYLKIGEGKRNALLFAFPHPNEPIGSMTVEFLSHYLAENPEFTEELGYTWYLIKAVDPDGAALNEGWFKGEFNPVKYARHYYRPPSHEQIEWTFPVSYKKLEFNNPPVETRALMKVMNKTRPDFLFSLHNAGFCGVYYYISKPIQRMYPEYVELVNSQDLPLHRGEPETPYIKTLAPAIYQMFGIQNSYDFFTKNGVENPQELIKSGTSSYDYLNRITDSKGFTLVCEMPYFYDRALGDDTETEHDRRKLVLEAYEKASKTNMYVKKRFDIIKEYCDIENRLYTAVNDFVGNFEKRQAPRIHHAETSPMYEGKATVAQAFDSQVSRSYYQSLITGMTARLCGHAMEQEPSKKGMISGIKDELDVFVEENIKASLMGTTFEVIPIRKLVSVQVGSALITLKHI